MADAKCFMETIKDYRHVNFTASSWNDLVKPTPYDDDYRDFFKLFAHAEGLVVEGGIYDRNGADDVVYLPEAQEHRRTRSAPRPSTYFPCIGPTCSLGGNADRNNPTDGSREI
ncbi:hypothetical protein CLOM_g23948 [Closterium sp. NIES-68]|nr:hypothetical protein CLOM_g23948 [Closterium sp. NIES-68]GJP83966.1 hypothetical protein CLOP_g14065 [Closterium sp. NIES-67]